MNTPQSECGRRSFLKISSLVLLASGIVLPPEIRAEYPINDRLPQVAQDGLRDFYREHNAVTFEEKLALMRKTLGPSNVYPMGVYDPAEIAKYELGCNEYEWSIINDLIELILC